VGATGAIAAEYVAKSPADGYTLFWATTPQVSIVPLIQKVNYDPLKDFAPVSIFGKNTYVLAVHISIPAKTLKEFIEYVRAHPGELSYSSAGTGSTCGRTPENSATPRPAPAALVILARRFSLRVPV